MQSDAFGDEASRRADGGGHVKVSLVADAGAGAGADAADDGSSLDVHHSRLPRGSRGPRWSPPTSRWLAEAQHAPLQVQASPAAHPQVCQGRLGDLERAHCVADVLRVDRQPHPPVPPAPTRREPLSL